MLADVEPLLDGIELQDGIPSWQETSRKYAIREFRAVVLQRKGGKSVRFAKSSRSFEYPAPLH